MIKEAIRIVTAILEDSTYGVNAKIAALPVESGEDRPDEIVSIYDETDDADVAHGRLPDADYFPCVTVQFYDATEWNAELMNLEAEGDVDVLIRVGMEDTETAEGMRKLYDTQRAVVQSLRELNSNAAAAICVRNGVQCLRITKVRQVKNFAPIEDADMTAGVVATLRIRDLLG